jgi:polyisoprenyl-phosphate glycosyltransferase
MNEKKLITVITPCYNEEENILDVYKDIKKIFDEFPQYRYEHLFIDNSSTDKTLDILKNIAKEDFNVKIIVTIKNFGHIRSPYHAILQSNGDAIIIFASNLKDPPELIREFIKKWEEGYKTVIGIKNKSKENPILYLFRKMYYKLMRMISETEHIENFIGYGLYDKSFIEVLRKLNEPYPYFRGLVAEFGSNRIDIPYTQLKRQKGSSKNNLYTLFDMAMLGFVNHSKVPIRLATFMGFGIALLSIIIAIVYFVYKILFWNNFQVGIAPLTIGLFFFSSVQLIFIGIIGEYVGAIYTNTKNRPLVIEKERINFD